MITLRKAQHRGQANFGWLDSKHTFSFGSYYDESHMGFSELRVINDDTVEGGAGFGIHGHRDMEIISFVTQGVIEHKDSMGNIQSLPKGEFQIMSAGKGVQHSEYNGSKTEQLKFLQIWIQPNEVGGMPGYQQKHFGNKLGITPIITPTGDAGTLKIKQNAKLSQLLLAQRESIDIDIDSTRKIFIHLVDGQIEVNGHAMQEADGAKIAKEKSLSINNTGDTVVTALIFDLP